MENGLLGFAPGAIVPPDTVNAYLDSATSPNIVSFEADTTAQLPNPALPILEWQTATSGSGATAVYGASVFTGASFTQTLASGTLAARCRVWSLGLPVTDWAYSALVTFAAPSGGGFTPASVSAPTVVALATAWNASGGMIARFKADFGSTNPSSGAAISFGWESSTDGSTWSSEDIVVGASNWESPAITSGSVYVRCRAYSLTTSGTTPTPSGWVYLGGGASPGTATAFATSPYSGGGGGATGAEIRMGSQGYSLTTSYALASVAGQAPWQVSLPSAGSYLVTAVVALLNGATANDDIRCKLYNVTTSADIANTEIANASLAANARGEIILQAVVTVTGATNIGLYAVNNTAARGSILSLTGRLIYLTLSSASTYPLPYIGSFSPSGGTSTSVTITGTGFTGATAVTFNGVAASAFTVASDTSITATSPASFTDGLIKVTTPGGTATSVATFTASGTTPPSSLANLLLWYKASDLTDTDGTSEGTWTDKTTNHYNATQATGSQQPVLKTGSNGINSQNVLRFTSAGNSVLRAITLSYATYPSICVYGVYKVRTLPASFGCCWSTDQTTGGYQRGLGVSSAGVAQMQGGSAGTTMNGGTLTAGTAYIIGSEYSSTAGMKMYVNQTLYSSATVNSNTGYQLYIGNGYTDAQPLNVDCPEFFIFSRALTPTEHGQMQSYLNGIYGCY